MNFRECKEANELIDELKNIDSFIIDVQSPERTLKVFTNFKQVTIKKEHRTKIIQVILGIRGELAGKLEKLGVVEDEFRGN